MIYTLILSIFLIFSICLFLINNYILLLVFLLLNVLLIILLKINLLKFIKFILKNLLFVLFIFICNIIFIDLNTAIMTTAKLFLLINLTYTISNILTPNNISEALYYMFYPLKIFKINVKNISLIISIALTFIPILMDEAKSIKNALLIKGFSFNFKNVITKPHIFLITYINGIFDRTDELERTLIMKAYE